MPKGEGRIVRGTELRTLDRELEWLFSLGYRNVEIQTEVHPAFAPGVSGWFLVGNVYRMPILPSCASPLPGFVHATCHWEGSVLIVLFLFQNLLPQRAGVSPSAQSPALCSTLLCGALRDVPWPAQSP